MKTEIMGFQYVNGRVKGDTSANREFLAALRQWGQKLGYFSIFAAVSTLVTPDVDAAYSNDTTSPKKSTAERKTNIIENRTRGYMVSRSIRTQGSDNLFVPPADPAGFSNILAGRDDCPGQFIPSGNYTAAEPFIDSGSTARANNTVNSVCHGFNCYYSFEVAGGDHIYAFKVTHTGPNPLITVSSNSIGFQPWIYILDSFDGCPNSTGHHVPPLNFLSPSWRNLSLNGAPIGRTLHLFVDSIARFDGDASYTIRIQDVTLKDPRSRN